MENHRTKKPDSYKMKSCTSVTSVSRSNSFVNIGQDPTTLKSRSIYYEKMRIHVVDGRTYLVQFTAGMAYELARACSRSFMRLSPVTTPEGTISAREVIFVDFDLRYIKSVGYG